MLSYSLCKKLKEAGFPQVFKKGVFYYNPKKQHCLCAPLQNTEECLAKDPALSELIEACGERFGKLIKWGTKKGFEAFDILYKDTRISEFGIFPEEAVAKLWIKLNKTNGG